MRGLAVVIVLVLFSLSSNWCAAQDVAASSDPKAEVQSWPQWRGPLGTGEAPSANPPVRWSETENVKWKVPIPGLGHSSPIVWDDKIFLTTAIPFGEPFAPIADGAPGSHDNLKVSQKHRYSVVAINRENGTVAWKVDVNENVPHEGGHDTASLASASPVTDGQHVYAYFGSHGLYCLDMSGNVVWKKDLGKMHSKHAHGEGASPVLANKALVINWDHEGQSFIAAYDKKTGNELWNKKRDEVTSWATPIVVEVDNREQVIVAGTSRIRSYDVRDGSVNWECGGLSNNVVATPVVSDGVLIAGSSYDTKNLLAIKLAGAKGDITSSQNVLWTTQVRTPYVPSPLVYKGSVYFLRHYQGVLTRVELKTGAEPIGPFRLNGLREIYASPAAAADRLYITGRSGLTFVISHVDIPKLHSVNQLDDRFSASPAFVGNQLIMRGEKFLYCLETKK